MLENVAERTAGPVGPAADVMGKVKALAEAAKLKSVVLLTFVGFAGGVYAAAGDLRNPALWLGTLAVAIGSMGTNGITGFIDRRMDAIMARTKSRPVPEGRLTPRESLIFGLVMVAVSLLPALATGHPWSLFWLLFGILDTTLIYNGWSKPRTPWNVVLGSPAGGATIMVVTSAVTGQALGLVPFTLAALVVAWTPVHIWSLAILHVDDYRAADVPMLPVVYGVDRAARCAAASSLFLCGFGLVLPIIARFNPAGLVISLILPIPVVVYSLIVGHQPDPRKAYALFKLSSPYLAAVFLLLIWQALLR
ncbi:MAG TPA: protoheme IX farnesyltransferase [Bacillota bacterium]|jgi:protoheme IX farnesyltransferase